MDSIIRVLYVDDENDLLEIGKLFLERIGQLKVDVCTSAQEALSLLKSTTYDAIISDFQMPEMDGIAFLKVVRSSGDRIPFILFTGRGREEVVIEAINEGADSYIQKGGDPRPQFSELAHRVQSVVHQRRAEYYLKESEVRYRDLAELLPQIVFETDSDLRITYANQHMVKTLGITNQEIEQGIDALSFIDPEEHYRIIDGLDKVLKSQKFDRQFTMVCRDKSTFTALIYISPIYHADTPTGFRGVVVDISDRILIEQNLQIAYEKLAAQDEELQTQYDELKERSDEILESEERYRSIVNSVPVGMHFYQLDTDGRLIFIGANPAADTMLGISHNTLIGKSIEEAFPLLKGTEVPDRYQEVITKGNIWTTEQIDYQDGKIKGSFSVSAFKTEPNRMVAAFYDITEKMQSKEKLQKMYEALVAQQDELKAQNEALEINDAEWNATFNAISDWVTVINKEGQIIRSNKASESLLGLPPDAVIGKKCFELVHGTSCAIENCPRIKMKSSRKTEVSLIPIHNGASWFQVVVDPVINTDGEVIRAVHIIRDITKTVQSQKILEKTNEKLNLLSYVIFSDIKNLIIALSGYQDLIRTSASVGDISPFIKAEEQIIQKINQALDYAQNFQNLGLVPARWQKVSTTFLMAISHLDLGEIKHQIILNNLELFADPLLEHVFLIFVKNTINYGKSTTQITIRYKESQDSLIIIYEDDGLGVPNDLKTQIFLRDFKESKTIGLYLASEILKITGITIQETGEYGKGVRFEMVVPPGMWRFQSESNEEES